jgi:PAS domain S-box-containing protein
MLGAGGEMAEMIYRHRWEETPLGQPQGWPAPLRVALGICLNSSFPMAIYWGEDLRLLYNDGWAPIPGDRHPDALGRPAREVWPDIWHIIEPQFREVLGTGRGYSTSGQHLPITRDGRAEESYWDYSFIPIAGEDGRIAGIMNQGHEVTARVFERQRHGLLLGLADRLRALDSEDAIAAAAMNALGPHLGVARAGYAEIDLEAGSFRVVHNWRRDANVADLLGVHPLGAFGDVLHAALRSGASFSVEDVLDDPRIAGGPAAAAYAAAGIRSGLVVPVLKGGVYAGAIFVQDDRPRFWTPHHETLLAGVAERVWQESGRCRSSMALRASEQRHRLIFEQANDIVFTADLQQRVTSANPAAGLALGVSPAALLGRSVSDFISPEDFERTSERLLHKLTNGGTTRYDVMVRPGDGRELRWEVSSTLATDPAGEPIGLHAIARDMTERHAQEQSQKRLIDELNHRVKNMLALVQGLALQSFKGGRPLHEEQAAFQARLSALATAHDLLTQAKWEGTTLDEIVASATRPFADPPTRVTREGPAVSLVPKLAVSLMMAFHELATNAARDGALSEPNGTLAVRWRIAGDRLTIEWREEGGPVVAEPVRRGFGLRMVERALATDLAARIALDFEESGLVCSIDAPVPEHAA